MWKCVSRRSRDTIERSANHLDKCSAAGVANPTNNSLEDKNIFFVPPCRWFTSRKGWKSLHPPSDINEVHENNDDLTWNAAAELKNIFHKLERPFTPPSHWHTCKNVQQSINTEDKNKYQSLEYPIQKLDTAGTQKIDKDNAEETITSPCPLFTSQKNLKTGNRRRGCEGPRKAWRNANAWKKIQQHRESIEKYKNFSPLCHWGSSWQCRESYRGYSNTDDKQKDFEYPNGTWIGAITWSSALIFGYYASQLIHLKNKYKQYQTTCTSLNNLLYCVLHPYVIYVNKNAVCLSTNVSVEKIINLFTPTVHLMSNDQASENDTGRGSSCNITPDNSDSDLSDVLNSIENKLGLAAIENGHHKDGLNLLRSAANRNHAPALYNLGLCHEMGVGVAVDEKIAMELYRAAASLQHPGAMYNLGVYYGQGRGGLVRDVVTGARLLRLAAVQGHRAAIDAVAALQLDNTIEDKQLTDHNGILAGKEKLQEAVKHGISQFTCNERVPPYTSLFVDNANFLNRGANVC